MSFVLSEQKYYILKSIDMFIQAYFIRKALGFLIFGSRQSHFSLSFFFFLQKCNTFFALRKQEIERLLLTIATHDPICCLCEEKNMEDGSCSACTITRWAYTEEQRLVNLPKTTFMQQPHCIWRHLQEHWPLKLIWGQCSCSFHCLLLNFILLSMWLLPKEVRAFLTAHFCVHSQPCECSVGATSFIQGNFTPCLFAMLWQYIFSQLSWICLPKNSFSYHKAFCSFWISPPV